MEYIEEMVRYHADMQSLVCANNLKPHITRGNPLLLEREPVQVTGSAQLIKYMQKVIRMTI